MANKSEFKENFETIEEPSLESSDPNERKFARRLRIQKYTEALKKLDTEDSAATLEESATEKQIFTSTDLLEKLIAESNEVITNVRVANDAREIEREKRAKEIEAKLFKRLEENTQECERQCEIINKCWPVILKSNDPLEINDAMLSQAEKCNLVLAKKDAIIEELKQELERADNVFIEDQKKQKDDIKLLIERIENQMTIMENAYSRELQLIQNTLKVERDTLIENFQKKWETLYMQEVDENLLNNEKLHEIVKNYDEEMERLMRDHDEEYREQKISLDKECQALQQKVERTKASCLLKTEQLSYNYIILKNRADENCLVKNEQKRKISKLQGTVAKLKQDYKEMERNSNQEMEKLSKQILKAHKNITELEEKSEHFTRVNEKQYMDIWNMNTENANELVEKILTADRIIHERTLGVLWEAPQNYLPKKEDMPSYIEAVNIIKKSKEEEIETYKMFHYEQTNKSCSEVELESKLLSNILKQISTCSEYLIEDKLQELLLNRSEEEKTIIKLDNIFQALSISSPEEINMLLNFFLPYAYCVICSDNKSTTSESPSDITYSTCKCSVDEKERDLIDFIKKEIQTDLQCNEQQNENLSIQTDSFNYETSSCQECSSETTENPAKSRFTCDKGHLLQIQTIHVTQAINDITTKCNEVEQKNNIPFNERLRKTKFTISRNLSQEDVKNYWSKYRQIFSEEKEKLWDVILIIIKKYYEILHERHKICTEIEKTKKQNAEFQRLLQSQEGCAKEKISSIHSKPITKLEHVN